MELQVEGRNMTIPPAWQEKIENERDKLVRYHGGLVYHLRVSVESTSQQREGGYAVRLVASVPNDTVVVKRRGENGMKMIVEAFDVLHLQLKEIQRKHRQEFKVSETDGVSPATGTIRRLYPFESYGFIATEDNREIYFHENALKGVTMEQLTEGDDVRFGEADGDKGPCASWVTAVK